MAKYSNDAAMELMMKRHQQNKDKNIGSIIADTFITPDMPEKQQVLVKIKDVYSAPKKYNFYDKLSDDKTIELIESIKENGILSPVVLYKCNFENVSDMYEEDEIDYYGFDGLSYMILSGHNRCNACNELYKLTNDKKYESIPAIVFEQNELDTEQIREIIIDTNYVQRVLNTKETHLSIMHKYAEVERDKNKKGRTREIVAEQLGISSAKVEQYKKLDKLIQPMRELVYADKIALTSMLKIVDKSDEIQQWIYDTYGDQLTNKMLNKVKPYMKKLDIQKVFDKELQPKITTKKVSVDVPEEFIEEFKEMAYQWLYNKTKRE